MPTDGAVGFLGRLVLWLAFPVILWAGGFLTREERERLGPLLRPSAVRASLAKLRSAPGAGKEEPGASGAPEAFEQANRDIDRL